MRVSETVINACIATVLVFIASFNFIALLFIGIEDKAKAPKLRWGKWMSVQRKIKGGERASQDTNATSETDWWGMREGSWERKGLQPGKERDTRNWANSEERKSDGISGEGVKVKMDYVTCPGGAGTSCSLSSGPCWDKSAFRSLCSYTQSLASSPMPQRLLTPTSRALQLTSAILYHFWPRCWWDKFACLLCLRSHVLHHILLSDVGMFTQMDLPCVPVS